MATLNPAGSGGNQILVFKKMRIEDIGKDTRQTLQNFAAYYNQFGQTVYNLLSGQLEFGTNVQGLLYSTSFTTPANYSDGANFNFTQFSFGAGFTPINNVLIGKITVADGQNQPMIKPVSVSWVETTQGQVTVQYITGLGPSTKYNINFQVT